MIAFIASLNPYFLIITVPLFIIGVVLIWLSAIETSSKNLWTALPVILWYPSFLLFMYSSGIIGTRLAQKLDFIFPKDFKGQVMIIEKMKCGQPKMIIDGREQLIIPKNGILLYQGELKQGYVNHKYYQLLSNNKRIELPERANHMYFSDEKSPPDSTTTGVWLSGTGSGTLYPQKENINYRFMYLLVASKEESNKFYEFNYMKTFEKLAETLIIKCK